MKIAGIRELRTKTATLLGGTEPLLVTRYGRLAGLYIPLEQPDQIPMDLRRELAAIVGRHLAQMLQAQGVSEEHLHEEFHAHRRAGR